MWKDILKAPFDTREYQQASKFSQSDFRKFLTTILDPKIRGVIDKRTPRKDMDGKRTYKVRMSKYGLTGKERTAFNRMLTRDKTDFTEEMKRIFDEEYNMIIIDFDYIHNMWQEYLEFSFRIKDGL